MKLIPVIDLMHGQVVHAVRGDRANYRPLQSQLAPGSEARTIVAALLRLHPFSTLYVADLDAIQRRGDNLPIIQTLRLAFPTLSLWADAGFADEARLRTWLDCGITPVIGSETLTDGDFLDRTMTLCQPVLSLDFRGGDFLGPSRIFDEPQRWPQRLIAMTLARVGSNLGPDEARLASLRARAPRCELFAAGGVRDSGDLSRLSTLGVAGVLLASALHNGSLSQAQLAHFC
jgi:phosphoribosylformimino-5-aminoimidazole carboxamide ribotide isomerase